MKKEKKPIFPELSIDLIKRDENTILSLKTYISNKEGDIKLIKNDIMFKDFITINALQDALLTTQREGFYIAMEGYITRTGE